MKQIILSIMISLSCAGVYAQTVADIARREGERATTIADIGGLKDDVFRFYDVHGTTAAELRADIARKGPNHEGAPQQGFTNWSITWKALTASSGGKCQVTAVNVMLSVEIILPRWADEVGAQNSLSESWRRYLTGLLLHEHGHKDIALAGAEELRQLPKSLGPQASCDAADGAARVAGDAILEKTKARQGQYDKDTGHGRGQGVRLP